jgi:hypothetical protein
MFTSRISRARSTGEHSMKRFVQRTPKFDICLKDLEKAGGKAALASKRAMSIYETLVLEGDQNPFESNRLASHGEGRLHKCLKYNLGNGYRLVCFVTGNVCTFAYAGNHDDCDRWIRRQHSMVAHREPHTSTRVAVRRISPNRSPEEQQIEDQEDEYERLLAEKIEEGDILHVFRGLCKRG